LLGGRATFVTLNRFVVQTLVHRHEFGQAERLLVERDPQPLIVIELRGSGKTM
jgi:hypothetical protein